MVASLCPKKVRFNEKLKNFNIKCYINTFFLWKQELQSAFRAEAAATGNQRLILAAAVPWSQPLIDNGYEIPALCGFVDFVNLMSYDIHGAWESVTGHNSPLFSRTGETGSQLTMNVVWNTFDFGLFFQMKLQWFCVNGAIGSDN